MSFIEIILETGVVPSYEGGLLAINPTREDFATYDSNFKRVVDEGRVQDIVEGVVYYDFGAKRAYIVPEDHVEIIDL
jgi:hypothetical protein